jgi:hypothetical protein
MILPLAAVVAFPKLLAPPLTLEMELTDSVPFVIEVLAS